MWDNNNDHPAHRYKNFSEFCRALDRANKSGKGFRIAYTGYPSPDMFEAFADGVWEILDGRKKTYIIIEEYSDCCRTAGPLPEKTDKLHRALWTQGRKYGAILHATSQRPQSITKDAIGNAGNIWASSMDSRAAKRVGQEIDIHYERLRELQPGKFYHWKMGKDAQLFKVFTPKNT